jgi:hypothetical protein
LSFPFTGALLLGGILAAGSMGALAQQVLYRWIDDGGKTQYSDQPPKNFKGEVTRIETDENPPPVVAPRKPPGAKAEGAKPEGARDNASDYLAKRREKRAALEANRALARANFESAKKALEEGADPQSDELQVIGNRADNNGGRAGPGVARSNCRQARGADGRVAMVCSGVYPKTEYYDRLEQLQDALRKAEEALAAAEEAYRRGAD